jgi:dinuclear metal center YbgI/SA1388 family protein
MGASYTSAKLDLFFKSILDFEGFRAVDNSLNGIQVDNAGGGIGKIAFAVDASMESFQRAADCGAGMLFVHHGLFWGKVLALKGNHRQRLRFLLDHDICLYAAHLPLDQHPKLGNNAVLAELLGLSDLEPFGRYHGEHISFKGVFPKPVSTEDAAKKIAVAGKPPTGGFPFGTKENATCALVSGGAASMVAQAIEQGIDLFITGEMAHGVYHDCLEAQINMIAGGQ